MHKIGVVGPLASIDRILEMDNEYQHEITFMPFPYQESQEARKIVQEHRHQVDG